MSGGGGSGGGWGQPRVFEAPKLLKISKSSIRDYVSTHNVLFVTFAEGISVKVRFT